MMLRGRGTLSMSAFWKTTDVGELEVDSSGPEVSALSQDDATAILTELASTYSKGLPESLGTFHHLYERLGQSGRAEGQIPNPEAKYRALVEQLPAVVFMAYMDRGVGEAYVSPQIEATLGFSQSEWLEDPVLWY